MYLFVCHPLSVNASVIPPTLSQNTYVDSRMFSNLDFLTRIGHSIVVFAVVGVFVCVSFILCKRYGFDMAGIRVVEIESQRR